MERLKQQLRQELMMSRIPVMEALVFITIVTVISVELYMNIKQPLFTDTVHPMYPVYILVRVFYIMFLMGCVLGCFFERKMLRLFKPWARSIDAFDFDHSDYWECAQLFAQAGGLKEKMETLRQKCFKTLLLSRILWVLSYLTAVLVFSLSGAIYSSVGTAQGIGFDMAAKVIACIYLFLLLYFLETVGPVVPHMGGLLFCGYLVLYTAGQYLFQIMDLFLSEGTGSYIYWTVNSAAAEERLSSTLFILAGVHLYWICRAGRNRQNRAQNRILYYDCFINTYCGFAQTIYETAGDEEMVRFLETAGEAEETELLSDEKMDLLKKRQKELWNYIDGFSGQMLEQFAPVFERIPEWAFNLIEYDFSRKSE